MNKTVKIIVEILLAIRSNVPGVIGREASARP